MQLFSFNKKKRENAKNDYNELKSRAKKTKHFLKWDFKDKVKFVKESDVTDVNPAKHNKLKDMLTLASTIILTISLVGFVLGFIHFGVVNGNSMNDTLHNGNSIFMVSQFNISRDEIVVIDTSSNSQFQCEDIIKRVIGLPGDTIEIKHNIIYINGEKYNDHYAKGSTQDLPETTLADDEVFVLGDNREHSKDSLDVGAFKVKDVKWKVVKSW